MIVLINDVGSAHKINECSDSYSIVFSRRRCAVGGARIVKIILHTYLLFSGVNRCRYKLLDEWLSVLDNDKRLKNDLFSLLSFPVVLKDNSFVPSFSPFVENMYGGSLT